jgi:ParB family chromosome partitioning protein
MGLKIVLMNTIIQEIPLSEFDLTLSELRVMNQGRILQIEKSMRLHGQLQPVVARVYSGGYQLIDGFKRYYAAEDLMMKTLQCHVLEIDLSQAKVLLLSYNRSNQSMEAWEEAMVLRDLQQIHSLDQRSLAKLTGYSRSWVSRRLSLIEKMDEEVSSEIRMGALTGSHARSLIKLPRGNQGDVARVITTYRLTSRQSDTLVDAFLSAQDEDRQRYILSHPEWILGQDQEDEEEDPYDVRLSSYGNDLMHSIGYVIHSVQIMLSRLDDQRRGMLEETEKMIIIPGLRQVMQYCKKLTQATGHLPIHKSTGEDER